jgi:hypothetical protein
MHYASSAQRLAAEPPRFSAVGSSGGFGGPFWVQWFSIQQKLSIRISNT